MINNLIDFLLNQYIISIIIFDDLEKFGEIKTKKIDNKEEKEKCIMQRLNYTINGLKIIMMNFKKLSDDKKISSIKNSIP